MSFDLRQHIRTILAETSEENLDTLTSLVFEATPKATSREAYRQALPEVIRKELAKAPRLDHPTPDTQNGCIEPGQDIAGEGQDGTDTQDVATLPSGNVRNSRAALFRRTRFRISVWIGDKTYRNILECTAENLAFAAAESDRQAEANAATARKYRRLVKVMEQRQVSTVAELTDEEIQEALGDE